MWIELEQYYYMACLSVLCGSDGRRCDEALALLRRGVLEMLRARAEPQQYTTAELRLLAPGVSVSLGWCQTLAEVNQVHLKKTYLKNIYQKKI